MHVPKTAGTSFNSFLMGNLQPKNHTFIDDPLGIVFMPDEVLNNFDYIATHNGYHFFKRITVEHKKIMMLRHPVERALSMYYSQRELDNKRSILGYTTKSNSLEEFIKPDNLIGKKVIENSMTWQLVCDPNTYFREMYKDIPESELLEQALRNLKSFDFVGITEEFDTSCHKIKTMFNWKKEEHGFLNKTKNRSPLHEHDEHILRKIEDRVRLDLIVYHEALKIFNTY